MRIWELARKRRAARGEISPGGPLAYSLGEQPLLFACQGFVSALLLLVHVHMDDALVPRAFALERIAVALKARVPVEERRDGRIVLGRKFEPEDLAVVGNVAAVAHADNGAGNARAVQDVLGRDMRNADAGLDATAVEGGEAVADELEEGVHDVAQRLNGGCGFGRQSAIVQCLDVLAVIKHAVKLPFAELLYKVASRSLIFLGFSKLSLLQHSCPFGCS